MKKVYKNNYYNDEDQINFEKLNNFMKFNSNTKSNTQSKNHNIKYANSDKNYFNNILKTQENVPLLKKIDNEKKTKYYNSSDFQKFNQLSNFLEYKNTAKKENVNSQFNYSSSDYGEFNKIIKIKDKKEKVNENQNKKIKVIDYGKLEKSEKRLKNKMGIEKIKVVYFD